MYSSVEETAKYENVFQSQVFDYVKTNYVNLKKQFQEAIQGNNTLGTLIKIQNYQSLFFQSPLISYQIFNAKLGDSISPEDAQKYRLLLSFVKQRTKLTALKHLPELVYFYKLINQVFAFRLTEEDSLKTSVPGAIALLEKVETKETIQILKDRWESFKAAWLSVRDILAEMVGCPDQERNRAFESYILLLEDTTPIG
jgi:hypothetical protein